MKDKYVEMLRELVLEFAKCEIDCKIDFSDNVKRLLLFDKFEDHYIINEDMWMERCIRLFYSFGCGLCRNGYVISDE